MNCNACGELYEFQSGHGEPFYCGTRSCQKQMRFDYVQTLLREMLPGSDSLLIARGTVYLRTPNLNYPILIGAPQ